MAGMHSLHSAEGSLVVEHDGTGRVLWRHCGSRVDASDLPRLAETRGPASFSLDQDLPFGVAPTSGLGWFGPTLFEALGPDGVRLTFDPTESEIVERAGGLDISCHDDRVGIAFRLAIDVLEGGAFRIAGSLCNSGPRPITITRFSSCLLPLPIYSGRVISWRGRHNAELTECVEPLPQHRWERVCRRGISGHGGPPGLYLQAEEAGWHAGLTVALQLAWSGDSTLAIERDDEGVWMLGAETLLLPGELVLQPDESHAAPVAILAISNGGRNGAMAQQHAAVRSLVRWPGGAMQPRPVHLNSWEACYFDHDAERIAHLAAAGAAIGIERFVLDDGWFGARRDDTAGLGDWAPDPETYPDGLAPLARRIEALGMEFGLWVEPEMINPDSDLYRAHPDWVLATEGRGRPTARNQLVLDMRRREVRDHLFEQLDAILAETSVGYLKWDHNRDHAPSGGAAQTHGTYELLARLRAAHPDLEIEGCAGGGGRSDAGLAPYVHRYWTSDNIDAVARVAMQHGFLAFLPPEMMGSHVGASPAHATGRSQAMGFRCAVACMGHFGVELDPETLDADERAELARWIGHYKDWRGLLHGTDVALGEGRDGLRWQAHGPPGHKLLFCIRTSPPQDRRPQPLVLPFAGGAKTWHVRLLAVGQERGHGMPWAPLFQRMKESPVPFSGSWLAHAGLPMPLQKAESVAIFELKEIP